MKKELKGFVIGVLVTTMISSFAFAGSAAVKKKIDVLFNSKSVKVNGAMLKSDNIVYDGNTYVSTKALAEALGKDYSEDKKTNSVNISNKIVRKESLNIEKLPLSIKMQEPDSSGTVYMQCTYTNNTDYPITSMNMTVLLKDKNEKTYFSNHDTVMPGETSPIFKSFGPQTLKEEDYEILTIEARAEGDESYTRMEYDTKLKKYEYDQYKN